MAGLDLRHSFQTRLPRKQGKMLGAGHLTRLQNNHNFLA